VRAEQRVQDGVLRSAALAGPEEAPSHTRCRAVTSLRPATNELRSLLRDYYPAFLAAFAGKTANLSSREARAVLAIAPTPVDAARLTTARIAVALRRAGRQREIEDVAAKLHRALRARQLRQPALVERAMGVQALALLAALNAACAGADQLATATADAFAQHPDHAIITSFPGLADTGGARVLAEIGDDRTRFADPQGSQGVRRLRPGDPRLRAQHRHHPPTDQERPARLGRLDLGVRVADPLTRRTSSLRPPPSSRRPARSRAPSPV
jgi:hypothetical protein